MVVEQGMSLETAFQQGGVVIVMATTGSFGRMRISLSGTLTRCGGRGGNKQAPIRVVELSIQKKRQGGCLSCDSKGTDMGTYCCWYFQEVEVIKNGKGSADSNPAVLVLSECRNYEDMYDLILER